MFEVGEGRFESTGHKNHHSDGQKKHAFFFAPKKKENSAAEREKKYEAGDDLRRAPLAIRNVKGENRGNRQTCSTHEPASDRHRRKPAPAMRGESGEIFGQGPGGKYGNRRIS